jgi:hypothetical protein
LQFIQRGRAMFQPRFAMGRQRETTRRAVKQSRTKACLQARNCATDCGLGQTKLVGCSGKRTKSRNCHELRDAIEL